MEQKIAMKPAWHGIFRCFRMTNDPVKLSFAFAAIAFSLAIVVLSSVLVLKFDSMTGGEYSTQIIEDVELGKFSHAVTTLAQAGRSTLRDMRIEVLYTYHVLRGEIKSGTPFEARATKRVVSFTTILLFLLWMIWALFGGAISRAAAVEYATGTRLSLSRARSYAGARFSAYFWPPLALILFAIALFILIWVLGVAAKHPFSAAALAAGILIAMYLLVLYKQRSKSSTIGAVVGILIITFFLAIAWYAWELTPVWLSRISAFLMFPFAIIFGVTALLALIIAILGLGLMRNSVSFEGTDSIDAISRGGDYLFKRPWLILFYGIIASIYGSICIAFMTLIIGSGIFLALAGFQTAFGTSYDALVISHARFSGVDYLAFTFITLASVFILSWIIVFIHCFWSACYALIRRSVDLCDMSEIYLEAGASENQ